MPGGFSFHICLGEFPELLNILTTALTGTIQTQGKTLSHKVDGPRKYRWRKHIRVGRVATTRRAEARIDA